MRSITPVGLDESEIKPSEIVESTQQISIDEGHVPNGNRKLEIVTEQEEVLKSTEHFAEMFTKICLEIFDKNEEK
ncbi:MAG: hypothetical protein KA713_05250 [Chryseotalea sp. WA131a]|nr:MAG: hypothetical protein KA713_05250 [Chryseotalea sp. WA131a]